MFSASHQPDIQCGVLRILRDRVKPEIDRDTTVRLAVIIVFLLDFLEEMDNTTSRLLPVEVKAVEAGRPSPSEPSIGTSIAVHRPLHGKPGLTLRQQAQHAPAAVSHDVSQPVALSLDSSSAPRNEVRDGIAQLL